MQSEKLPASVVATLYPRLTEGESLDDLLRHVCATTIDVVDGADVASVTLLTGGEPKTFGATGDLALTADCEQYQAGGGPCLDAAHANQTVMVADLAVEDRWPAAPAMAKAGARSSLSIPLPVQDATIGALNLYALKPGVFDATTTEVASELASYAAIAVANAVSFTAASAHAEQLRQAMESRAVIEQAKGILIATTGCDAEAAFHLLVQQSQHENRKLREIAAELVKRNMKGNAT